MRKNGGEGPPSSTLRTTRGLERRRSPDVATLAIALSADRPREAGALFVVPDGGLTIGRGTGPALVEGRLSIADGRMSTSHARVAFEGDALVLTDLGSTNGSRVNGASVDRAVLRDGDVVELGYTFFVTRTTTLAMVRAAEELQLVRTYSPTFAAELARLARIARSELPVMLNGPTGTGKEVLARAIHGASGRPGPFVAVNCGALPATLIEAQLFGHTRGAFTGAVRDSRGFVRAAEHGTLLLDEVGELPAESQAALLRVLEEGEVVPVGSTTPEPVDVRIVSATHQRLDNPREFHILEGSFICPEYYKEGEQMGGTHGLIAKKSGVMLKNLNLRFSGNAEEMHKNFEERPNFHYSNSRNYNDRENRSSYNQYGGPSDGYGGSLDDDFINNVLDGDPSAIWNID